MGGAPDEAAQRNAELIEHLRASGSLHDAAVEAAFRRVLRHHFLPRLPLADVYEDAAIPTRTGSDGRPVSSSSQPAIMAVMLEQLGVEPGQRVLEIGAGTGYNASLLRHLVGAQGRVVSLDYDHDICHEARRHLAAAAIEDVEVVCSDGAAGWPPAAPYDRILLTVSSADVSPAWFEQLGPGGRLVLPLALLGPMQLSVCFRKQDDRLESESVTGCGFMPLRGELAFSADPAPADDPRLRDLLAKPSSTNGLELPAKRALAGFEAWLSLTDPSYVTVRTDPDQAPSFGLRDPSGLALVVGDQTLAPIAIHGDGQAAARRLVTAYRSWSRRRPGVDGLRVTAFPGPPSEHELEGRPEARVLCRPHFTFVLRWS
jgi:protein-L-isoaspartate(D-aspartate) O-methyltransferase